MLKPNIFNEPLNKSKNSLRAYCNLTNTKWFLQNTISDMIWTRYRDCQFFGFCERKVTNNSALTINFDARETST